VLPGANSASNLFQGLPAQKYQPQLIFAAHHFQKFDAIPHEIVSRVDYVIPGNIDTESTGKPSSIIALGKGNQVRIIRE